MSFSMAFDMVRARLVTRGPWLAAIAVMLSVAPRVQAQAALEVTVVDQASSMPLPAIEVALENTATRFRSTALTDRQGKARFAGLSTAGRYTVHVAESGTHYAATATDLTLRSNFERSLSLALTPLARASEALTVRAETHVAGVNGVNAEVASSLVQAEIEALPIEGRDITRALYRLPNVTQATGFYPEAPNVSVNGANGLYTSYLIDGLDNNENFLGGQKFAVPLGFVQEVSVLTSTYSAEFGRTGNGIFNITTRSGDNDVRGEVFYVTRPGAALDAASPFAQRDLSGNFVKNGFQRHQAGFAVGGPLLRDRTFYFVDAEWTRDSKDNLLSVPELGVNAGVPGRNEFVYLSGKLDHRFSDRWSGSLRVNQGLVTIERQGGGLEGGATFPSAANSQDRNSTLVAGRGVHVGTRLVSETGVQYSRFRWNYGSPRNPGDPQATVLGASGQTLAVLGHPGYAFDDVENTLDVQQKVTRHGGRHTLRVGGELIRSSFSLRGGGNANGNYLVQLTAQQEAALASSGRGAQLGVRDVPLDARVLQYSVELRPKAFGDRQDLLGLYAEDLLALSSRLNLTLGLRFDYDSLSRGGRARGDWNNFAPRLALNYRLDGASVLRAGYGVFYEKNLYAVWSDALQQNSTAAGFRSQLQRLIALGLLPADTDLERVTFDGNLSADFFSGVGYLQGPSPQQVQAQRAGVISGERRILSPLGLDNPRTQQLAVGYQRQIAARHLLYLDLIHLRAAGLPRLRDLNSPAPWPIDPREVVVRTTAQADATRPVPLVPGGARSIVITENAGRSRYWGASLNLVKEQGDSRFAWRLNYTLSRLENDTEDINFRAQDSNRFEAEWGASINDRRHVVNALGRFAPTRALALTLAALVQSGQPINRIPDARLYGTTDLNGDGRSFGDAYVGNSDRYPGERRNSDRLPWAWTLDLGVQYRLPLAGRRIELRADAFNLLNHTNLSGFSNNATQSNQIQAGPAGSGIVQRNAGPPRQIQLGARWVF